MRQQIVISCDVCGENLAALKDLSLGWVSWFARYDDAGKLGPVKHFYVSHAGVVKSEDGPACFGQIERRLAEQGFTSFDHHLSVFTGEHAMWRMQRLFWNYDWIRQSKAQERMLEFFRLAERLPTTKHGTDCREIEVQCN